MTNKILCFGEFKAMVLKDGKVVKELPWQKNLVTDQFIRRAFQQSWGSNLCVGTGNTPPSPGDVALDNAIARSNTRTAIEVDATPTSYAVTYNYRFNVGNATGILAELGLTHVSPVNFTPSETQYMHTRALFKDENGDPTTLTVLADEELQVIYKYGWALELDGNGDRMSYSGQVDINGVTHNWNAYIYSTSMGATLQQMFNSGTGTVIYSDAVLGEDMDTWNAFQSFSRSQSGLSRLSLEASDYKYTATFRVASDQGNFENGINGIVSRSTSIAQGPAVAVTLDPPVMKTDTQEFTFTLEVGSARAT